MTGAAALAHCFMLEDKRPSHFFVALEALFVLAKQHRAPCSSHVTSVHIMALIAEHSSFRYGVMVLEHEFAFNIKMAVKARCFSVCPDNLAPVVRVLKVKAARAVTRLTRLCLTGFGIFFCYVDCHTCMVG
jgi:hypothetical protein